MQRSAAAMALALCACTGPAPSEDLELAATPARDPAALRYASIPDREVDTREPPPITDGDASAGPRLVVGRLGQVENGAALCSFEVQTIGFPAVRDDTAVVVSAVAETMSASDGEDEMLTVTWHGADDDTVDQTILVYDGDAFSFTESGAYIDDPQRCEKLWHMARTRADEVNRQLRAHDWRVMTPMPIHIESQWSAGPLSSEDIAALPPEERPVELTYTFGAAVFRIRGVRVVSRHAVDWWGIDDEVCDPEPQLQQAFADRESGVVAIELDHQSGGCLCYPPTETHTLRAPPTLFSTIDTHPLRDIEQPA